MVRNGVWTTYTREDVPLPATRITGLLEASDGTVWILGSRQEAIRLDYDTSRWRTYEDMWFQCKTSDGTQWFTIGYGAGTEASGAVRFDGSTWTRYGASDGLMDRVHGIIATRKGEVWAVGSHDSTAATARFGPAGAPGVGAGQWSMRTHPDLSWSTTRLAAFEAADGSLWFGARTGRSRERGHKGGILRFDGEVWTHYTPPEAPLHPYGIGQTADGALWAGSGPLHRFDGESWSVYGGPEELGRPFTDAIYSTPEGDLWVGTRHYGLFHRNGQSWTQYGVRDGLADNGIKDIVEMPDGSVYAATAGGISRFDGWTWTTYALPQDLVAFQGGLRLSADGALWINSSRAGNRTTRYEPETGVPKTVITLSADEVSQPGNTTLAWEGADPWESTPKAELQFSWRMDEGEWSPFSLETSRVFQALPSGRHTFEVKARDRDLNEDSTPAQTVFTVVPPVWQQAWFVGLMLVVVVVVGYQAFRLVSRDRMLRVSNRALSDANNSLFQANAQVRAQNRWKSQFLVSMSHELRTPLNAIIGYTNLLLRQSKDLLPERQHANLQKVRQGGDYMLSLVDDLLDLTGIETGKVEVNPGRCQVPELMAACCATVGPLIKAGVTLSHHVADDIGEVETDQARLRQILVNLLGNAIKSTPEGVITVQASREGDTLVISVVDTGAGIPEEELDTVFDEFRQVEGSGLEHRDTGLGLAIAKKLTELLDGSIVVESRVGVGSTFTVRVPVVCGQG